MKRIEIGTENNMEEVFGADQSSVNGRNNRQQEKRPCYVVNFKGNRFIETR